MRITLQEARQLALRVLADTDRRLEQERISEARFTLGEWDEDEGDD